MVSDAHIHLAALSQAPALARHAAEGGASLLAVTCTPAEFEGARDLLAAFPNVRVALGAHPWELADGGAEGAETLAAAFTRAAEGSRLFGELGLDFAGRHAASHARQLEFFSHACRIAAQSSGVVSLHSRSAESELLDVLEETGVARACTCILHGFSGGGPALARARELGCLFSLGPRQLATRRGRSYAQQLPAELLLLESDADASSAQRDPSPACWAAQLQGALQQLEELRGCPMEGRLQENWHRIFESE